MRPPLRPVPVPPGVPPGVVEGLEGVRLAVDFRGVGVGAGFGRTMGSTGLRASSIFGAVGMAKMSSCVIASAISGRSRSGGGASSGISTSRSSVGSGGASSAGAGSSVFSACSSAIVVSMSGRSSACITSASVLRWIRGISVAKTPAIPTARKPELTASSHERPTGTSSITPKRHANRLRAGGAEWLGEECMSGVGRDEVKRAFP